MIQNSQQLKTEISALIDILPQEGVRLLAEFIAFLRVKFNLGQVGITAEPSDLSLEDVIKNIRQIPPNPKNIISATMSIDDYLAIPSIQEETIVDYHDWDEQWQKVEADMKTSSLNHELEEQKAWLDTF
ncbi:hypothetical protein QUF63_05210 [Anaerolineales bacterium HSG25]|nr:hypothetical protein [Anaerolineales bacterium HSG25]